MIVIFADFTSPINEGRSGCCPVDGCLAMAVDVKRDSRYDPRLSRSFRLIDLRAEHPRRLVPLRGHHQIFSALRAE